MEHFVIENLSEEPESVGCVRQPLHRFDEEQWETGHVSETAIRRNHE